jgi:hypothetical protein
MGLKINSPSNGFAVKSSLGADFAKALFGDPEMEIKFRRLQSDLVNDEYYRRAQAAATALNDAKTADQTWRTGAAQGAVDPAGQFFQDAMGPTGGGTTTTEPPVPIDLGDPNAVPIPAPRPDMGFGPNTYGPSELPPIIAGQARSQAQESPGNPPLEPNLRLTSFPRVSDFTLPGSAPVPTRRPGEFPDMPAPIGEADYGPSLTDAIPFSVDELLGTPPPVELEPQVPFTPLQGQPDYDAPHGPGPLFTNRPPLPAPDLRYSEDIGLTDIINYLTGVETPENLRPEPLQPEPPTAWNPGYPIEENTLDAGPVPPWNPQGAPGVENTLELPPPAPVTPFDAGMPIEENTLDYVPEPSHPFPVPIQPYEAPPRPEGAVTEIPGRGRVSPDGPFPPNLGGLDTGVPASVPPNVAPQVIPGKPFQGPPAPLPETPDVATGDTDVRGPAPEIGVIHNKAGQPIARLNGDDTRALAAAIIAEGGDVAGGLNKLAGGLGVTYGDIHDTDRLRINSMLATGNLPSSSTQITSEDKVSTQHDIDVANAAPKSLDSQYVQADGVIYMKDPDPNAKPGSLMVAPGQADKSGHLAGSSETINAYNSLIDLNAELDAGHILDASKQRAYGAAWKILNDPVTTSTRDSEGKLQASTVIKPPPGTLFRSPDKLTPGPAPAETAPAVVQPGETQADQAAKDRPAVAGQDIMVTPLYGRNKGKPTKVVNQGGWTSPGEKPPTKTDVIDTPGGGKVVTSVTGDRKTGQISDGARNTARFLYEAIPAAAYMNTIIPGKEPSNIQRAIEQFSKEGIPEGYWLNPHIDEDTRQFSRAMYTYINGRVRPDSGATIKPEEFVQYKDRFIVPPNATPQDYVDIMANRAASMRASRKTLNGEYPAEGLQDLDMQATKYGIDYDYDPATDERYQEFLRQSGKGGAGGGGAVTVDEDGKLNGL